MSINARQSSAVKQSARHGCAESRIGRSSNVGGDLRNRHATTRIRQHELPGQQLQPSPFQSLPLKPSGHNSVQKERMNSAIPNNIDKSDQIPAILGAYPAQAISIYLRPPVVIQDMVLKCLSVKRI